MLIGSDALNYSVLHSLAGDTKGLLAYVDSLVPTWARHIPELKMNQRYFAAVHIRNMLNIPFAQRKEMYTALIEDCSVHGLINNFIPISQIFDLCDTAALAELLRRDYE